MEGVEKAGDESDKGTYRASWEKGGLARMLGRVGLLGEVEAGWDQSWGLQGRGSEPQVILSPRRHLAVSPHIFGCHNRGGECYWHLVGGVPGCR